MTDNHPITIPAGLITGWRTLFRETYQGDLSEIEFVADQAAHLGADLELEACCAYISQWFATPEYRAAELRAARRPKPPSLKEQALNDLDLIQTHDSSGFQIIDLSIIRRALESLPDNQ